MSLSAENTTDTAATRDPEQIEEPRNRISHDLLEEKITGNLGPLIRAKIHVNPTAEPIDPKKFDTQFPKGGFSYSADTVETLTQ